MASDKSDAKQAGEPSKGSIDDEDKEVKRFTRKKSSPGQSELFDESKVKRNEDGEFTRGGGSSSTKKPSAVSADSGEFNLKNDTAKKPAKIEGQPKAKQEALFSKSGLPGQMNMYAVEIKIAISLGEPRPIVHQTAEAARCEVFLHPRDDPRGELVDDDEHN